MLKSDPKLNGIIRKRGETINKIIEIITARPGTSISDIAVELGVSAENIRISFNKLTKAPEHYAARAGLDGDQVMQALEMHLSMSKFSKIQNRTKMQWRGKANWPASKVATKNSISTSELVQHCQQHYKYISANGTYIGDSDIDNAGTLTKLPKIIK